MPEAPTRTIDHIVHAVGDLESAAASYAALGFTVTPRADHPFGTSNRLVVLDDSYLEIVAVTRPEQLPETGFAATVAGKLRSNGQGITHIVLSSEDPPADLAALGNMATGEIFSFSRPAPQPDGSSVKASFECTLMRGTDHLGMFLCKHLAPEAVWNESTTWHSNLAHAVTSISVPVSQETIDDLAHAAGVEPDPGSTRIGNTTVRVSERPHISFDAAVPSTDICGVTIGGRPD